MSSPEIEAALQRLDEGTYGIDEVTGDPIASDARGVPDRAHERRRDADSSS